MPPGKYAEFGKRLKKALEDSGYFGSNVKIGKLFGVSGPAVNGWLNGDKLPSTDSLVAISAKTKVSIDWLVHGKYFGGSDLELNVSDFHSEIWGELPLISFDRAGEWREMTHPYKLGQGECWKRAVTDHGERAFLLRVQGDSMWDGTGESYPDGCIAQFDPDIEPRHKDDVVVRTPDNKTTFKRLYITPDGNYLVALNPNFPNRMIEVPEGTVIVAVCQGYFVERPRK